MSARGSRRQMLARTWIRLGSQENGGMDKIVPLWLYFPRDGEDTSSGMLFSPEEVPAHPLPSLPQR